MAIPGIRTIGSKSTANATSLNNNSLIQTHRSKIDFEST